jgi:hypothetical protein
MVVKTVYNNSAGQRMLLSSSTAFNQTDIDGRILEVEQGSVQFNFSQACLCAYLAGFLFGLDAS